MRTFLDVIFRLNKDLIFPPPHLAEENGLLAVGGDLSIQRLILAYSMGIFPWFSEESPILWYSPHERFVLFPTRIKISKSMRKVLRCKTFTFTRNQAFEQVIKACANIGRKDQPGTWITAEMQEAYIGLHKNGIAHSVEVWQGENLAGGLYGVETGNIFCGESMFSSVSNASKAAIIWLCTHTSYSFIDCQFHTEHLESIGAEAISREEYMRLMNA